MSSPVTVLHVDDDGELLDLASSSFRHADAEIDLVTATNGEEGLETLESRSVDCIVSDSVRLSDGTLFVVAARERNDAVPIVLYTAKSWDDVALDALDAQISEYVRKGNADGIDAVVERAHELANAPPRPSIHEAALFDRRSDEDDDGGDGPEDGPGGDDGWNGPRDGDGGDVPRDEDPEGAWTIIGVHDWEADDELGTTIAQVLEAHTGVDALRAKPLFESLDVDALESVLGPRSDGSIRRDVEVRFPYLSLELLVSSDGFVAIRERPDEERSDEERSDEE